MSYGEIITSAFRVAWGNRYLWFYGVFAGAGANIPLPNIGGGGDFDFDGPSAARAAVAASQGSEIDPGLAITIGVAVVLLLLAFIVLSLIAQGALAESVAAIDRGGQRSFRTAWQAGTRHVWRVLGFVVLLLVIVLGLVLVIGIPLVAIVAAVFSATESLAVKIIVGVVAGLVGLAGLLLLLIPVQIIGQYGLREVVLRESRPVAALRGAYRLLRAHIGKSLILLLIQLGLAIGAALVLILAGLLVGLLLFLPTIALAIAELGTAALVTGIVAGVVLVTLLVVAYGALGAFNHSFWTLAYLRLRALPEGVPAAG
jgi:hypothetical protein